MYMNVAFAECKYLIYHVDIIIKYHDYIYFNLLSSFHSAYDLNAFQIKYGLISIS